MRDILAAVAKRGDAAVREYTSRFDGVELDSLVVADAELAAAMERIEPDLQAALELAADRIAAYHQAQMPADVMVEQPGVSIRGMHRAVERAACYVPGGRAVYPSTVLMTAVPARVAGVEQIVVCVPPGPDGKVPDIVLARRRSQALTRSCRSAVRRRSVQSRMAPSRFGPSTSSSVRATSMSRSPSRRSQARSASRRPLPGHPRWSWSPTAPIRPISLPSM